MRFFSKPAPSPLQARSKPAPSPLQKMGIAIGFLSFFANVHAADLPAITTGIKVEIPNVPAAWKYVGWVAADNDIYIIYGGELRDSSGTAAQFSINLKFTAQDEYKIKKVAEKTFEPPVLTYTKAGIAVSADLKESVPYTLVDGSEQTISGTVHLVAVETKVNDTLDPKDDLVAVSAGTDEDLATDFSIRTNGDGLTASLSVKAGDGDIKFKDTELNLVKGAYVTTKLWGISPSTAVDKSIILTTVKMDGKAAVDVEENCTVFKGVNLYFDGTFVANVNSVPEGWRPDSTSADADEKTAAAQDVQDWNSLIKFQGGDQGGKRRSWTPAPSVTITGAETVNPKISLDHPIEAIAGADLSLLGGLFKPSTPDPRINETIMFFDVVIKGGGNLFGGGKIVDPVNWTAHQRHPGGDLLALGGWDTEANITSKIDGDTAGNEIKTYYKEKWRTLANLLNVRQQWTNESLTFRKEAKAKTSFAMKGMLGAQELKANHFVSIRFNFQRFNIWYLSGDIESGVITSEPLP